ncbi:MAG: pyrroline-5-carboxylate reductase family protein [Elusimicrobiota bacterium]
MLKNKKITVIGAGHMGEALIGGMIRAKLTAARNITAARRNARALADLRGRWKINAATADNARAIKGADIILLTVKPQIAASVLDEIAPAVSEKQIIISVMAGITTASINSRLNKRNPVIRAMPNTPALVAEAATALAAGVHANQAALRAAELIFKSVGKVEIVPENL